MAQYEDKSDHTNACELNRAAYSAGCMHYDEQDFARAKTAFESALEYGPEDGQAWFALGNCHDALRQPAKAEACYRMSLTYAEVEAIPNVFYNLGNSLLDQGRYAEAVDCYERVNGQSPAYGAAQKNMALARARLT